MSRPAAEKPSTCSLRSRKTKPAGGSPRKSSLRAASFCHQSPSVQSRVRSRSSIYPARALPVLRSDSNRQVAAKTVASKTRIRWHGRRRCTPRECPAHNLCLAPAALHPELLFDIRPGRDSLSASRSGANTAHRHSRSGCCDRSSRRIILPKQHSTVGQARSKTSQID